MFYSVFLHILTYFDLHSNWEFQSLRRNLHLRELSVPGLDLWKYSYIYKSIAIVQCFMKEKKTFLEAFHDHSYPITSIFPSIMTYISRATSPFLQTRSPGVNILSFICSTRWCRNSGWHFCKNVTLEIKKWSLNNVKIEYVIRNFADHFRCSAGPLLRRCW